MIHDFYVGIGPNAKFIGSVEADKIPMSVKRARTPELFEKVVTRFISRNNGTTMWNRGYDTSGASDYSYWLHEGKLYVLRFGVGYRVIEQKRGRPSSFVRDWELVTHTPVIDAEYKIKEDFVGTGIESTKHPMSLSLDNIVGTDIHQS